ncbi:hypothetical protein JW935_13790 [candidate division KSB1 bacterium]|nr:hypothetical protein [candidate division KSB1 bacterium]
MPESAAFDPEFSEKPVFFRADIMGRQIFLQNLNNLVPKLQLGNAFKTLQRLKGACGFWCISASPCDGIGESPPCIEKQLKFNI